VSRRPLTLEAITEMTAHLPPSERAEVRIRLACELVRREVRALRRILSTPPSTTTEKRNR
jgi:hypothetical protein